jgi:uncharacterized protein
MKESRPEPVIIPGAVSRPVDKYDAPSLMAKPGESQFHVMIKPAGAACNLTCTYCFYLDHITKAPLGEMALSRQQVMFGYAKHETLPAQCRQCPYLRDCWGECPKNRLIRTADGEPGLNYLCRGFKQFFSHAIPEIDRIVSRLRQHPPPSSRM